MGLGPGPDDSPARGSDCVYLWRGAHTSREGERELELDRAWESTSCSLITSVTGMNSFSAGAYAPSVTDTWSSSCGMSGTGTRYARSTSSLFASNCLYLVPLGTSGSPSRPSCSGLVALSSDAPTSATSIGASSLFYPQRNAKENAPR